MYMKFRLDVEVLTPKESVSWTNSSSQKGTPKDERHNEISRNLNLSTLKTGDSRRVVAVHPTMKQNPHCPARKLRVSIFVPWHATISQSKNTYKSNQDYDHYLWGRHYWHSSRLLSIRIDCLVYCFVSARICRKEIKLSKLRLSDLIWNLTDSVGCRNIFTPRRIILLAIFFRGIEVCFHIRNSHLCVLGRRSCGPKRITVGPMWQDYLSRRGWDKLGFGHVDEPFPVRVKTNGPGLPIESILMNIVGRLKR